MYIDERTFTFLYAGKDKYEGPFNQLIQLVERQGWVNLFLSPLFFCILWSAIAVYFLHTSKLEWTFLQKQIILLTREEKRTFNIKDIIPSR